MPEKIGFGGSCHWCTEAIFQSLRGVSRVEQGWIRSKPPHDSPSEAVLVQFNPSQIELEVLIQIHLHTHSCTSNHSMRDKYRSAVYTFGEKQHERADLAIQNLQVDFANPIITQALPYSEFVPNDEKYINYYFSAPERPFCKLNISPKLCELRKQYSEYVDARKLEHLG